jgi:MATE family multidrug resistance protein
MQQSYADNPDPASQVGKLTKYEEGSIKEVLQISYPLMLSYLSGYLMWFIDRIILARFSSEAINTVATVGLVCYVFDYALIGVTSIVEVLVGRLNGSGQHERLGEPVWQAIWLCIFSFAICVPLAFWGDSILVPKLYKEYGEPYYFISMLCCPLFGISAGLSAFFIGRGQGLFVTLAVLISNLVKLFLSIVLVFGFWVFPRLGVQGAVFATAVGQIVQIAILASVFFSKTNRTKYGCNRWRLNPAMFKEVLYLGLPHSLSHVLEMSAWALVANMLSVVSNDQVTLFSLGQSLFVLFAFFSEGLQKGVMAISANFVGAKRYDLLKKNLAAASYVHLGFCVALLLLLLVYPSMIIKVFFAKDIIESADQHMVTLLGKVVNNCFWVLLYFTLDGLVWMRSAILTSLGDMKFIMFANTIAIIVFGVLPIYFLIVKSYYSVDLSSWQLVTISSIVNLIVFSYRSRQKVSAYSSGLSYDTIKISK